MDTYVGNIMVKIIYETVKKIVTNCSNCRIFLKLLFKNLSIKQNFMKINLGRIIQYMLIFFQNELIFT